jgi:hypothetical protein
MWGSWNAFKEIDLNYLKVLNRLLNLELWMLPVLYMMSKFARGSSDGIISKEIKKCLEEGTTDRKGI